ncbi:MAG: PD-(D/E)XK nuclease family protein [Pseudomonadota bacterium]
MQIHFGIQLDGLHPLAHPTTDDAPDTPEQAILGVWHFGPLGLIRWLETELGVPAVTAHSTEQLLAYQTCLETADQPERFYSRSFALDPLTVTRTLLSWRASWYLGGWDGSPHITASSRLYDLFAVEQMAQQIVPLCEGQRVQRLTAALAAGRRTQLTQVTLHDRLVDLPYVWQQLMAHLPVTTAPGVAPRPAAPATSDLGRVQRQLLQFAQQERVDLRDRTQLSGDGSVLLVQATSRDISADWLAAYVGREQSVTPTISPQTLVVAEQDGIIIDNALERGGLPRCGFTHLSRSRPLNQLIKLALSLLWAPVAPHQLLQFLLHPLAPLSASVRQRLASAVASQPGCGGQAWQAALADIGQTLDGSDEASVEAGQRHLRQIETWLAGQRFDPEQGAPIEVLLKRVQDCRRWVTVLQNTGAASKVESAAAAYTSTPAIYGAALGQTAALLTALEELRSAGRQQLPKIELDRLVHDVSRPQADPTLLAQAGHVAASAHAACVTRAWSQVIWWDMRAVAPLAPPIWSSAEQLELQAAGIHLPDQAALLQGHALARLRPVLNCRDRLVMVVHDDEVHQQVGKHPVWQQLNSAFTGYPELNLDDVLWGGVHEEWLQVPAPELRRTDLPARVSHWQLPPHVDINPRAVESYSSLSKLFFFPHEWVLNYAARLHPGRAEDLSDGNLLYGNLAHRLFELFFQQHGAWQTADVTDVERWLRAVLPVLIETEGAVLLEPGRGVDRQRVCMVLEQSLVRLLEHLRSADIVKVEPEQTLQRDYVDGVTLQGTVDLLLTHRSGRQIVLDAKWGGERYRGQELRENRQLQLFSYAYLLSYGDDWPEAVYFVISTGNILAQDNRTFPQALTFTPVEPIAAGEVWRQGLATYAWRMQQLKAGRIDLPGAAAADGMLHNDGADDPFDDFRLLLGWGEWA